MLSDPLPRRSHRSEGEPVAASPVILAEANRSDAAPPLLL